MKVMLNRFSTFFILVLSFNSSLCAQNSGDWLFSINDKATSVEEFEYVYKKNNSFNPEANSKADIDNYLELFINFKLKVQEARSQGIDTTDAYKRELAQYEKQIAEPYLTEKEVTEELIVEAYNRSLIEVDVSHILISVTAESSPSDTLEAYEKAMNVYKKALEGEEFGDLAVTYSDEPGINQTRGHLGYFTALQMVYPFESAAFELNPGEISKPIRTQYGYHIIRSNDKRPTNGRVEVSHLMKRFKPGMTATDSLDLISNINRLYELANSGSDWLELCKNESEDFNTRNKGGLLPEFGVGEMLPQIAEEAFQLDSIRQISRPIMTSYGWHILRLESKTEPKPLDEIKTNLERRVKRDARSNKSKKVLISRLMNENKFIENQEMKNAILSNPDSSMINAEWHPAGSDQTLFSIGEDSTLVNDFSEWVNKNTNKSGPGTLQARVKRLYDLFVQENLIEYERAHLEEKYPDFKYLIKEYREGVLLFDIMDREIWSFSSSDSIGLRSYFDSNSQEYTVPKRADLIIFDDLEDSNGDNVLGWLEKEYSRHDSLSVNKITELLRKEFPNTFFDTKSDIAVSEVDADPEAIIAGNSLKTGSRDSFVFRVKEKRFAKLDEVKGLVISDYQNYLDSQWITTLRSNNDIVINKKALRNVYKRLE